MSYSDSTSFEKSNGDVARFAVINARVLHGDSVAIEERRHVEKINPVIADI
jgi:hypothetical protein